MPGVFISYRRDDTKGYAGALLRELNSRIGSDQVFMDIEDIEGGTDFPAVLRESVQSCDVLLALIGPNWLDARDAAGNRRLDNPRDFVRQEIALALESGARVIPVLVEGIQMPAAEQLPPDLKALATRNALTLGNTHWDEDVARLTDHIREGLYALGVEKAASAKLAPDFFALPAMSRKVKQFVTYALGFGVLFGALGLGLMIHQLRFEARSQHAEAEVVRLMREDSDEGNPLYRPELQYVDANGQVVRFTSGNASSPPAYDVGDRVQILYDSHDPDNAVIDSFMGRWFLTFMFAGFGVLWLLLGLAPLIIRRWRRMQLSRLLQRGKPVITSYKNVEENTTITVQGRHPYYLVTEWRHPVSKELVHFRSHQMWDDPTEKAKNRMITVVVDPDNFRRYAMDLSFLREKPQPRARVL